MDIEKVKNIIQECIKAVSSGVPNCKLITEELCQVLKELEEEDIQYLNFKECDLRIKPRYRPFKSVKECWEEMQNHLPFGWIKPKSDDTISKFMLIVSLMDEAVRTNIRFNYHELLENYTFADGTPFGILEEEWLWHG